MSRSQTRDSMRSASMLALQDLDARLAPLDRYGLPGVSSAIVEGLHALFVVSMSAARLSRCCSRRRRGWSGRVGGAPALLRIRGCLRLLARQSAEQPGQSRSSNWLRLKHESSDEQQDCILRAPQQASFAQCGIWRTAPDKDASGPAARPARAANRNGASTVVKGVRQCWLQRIETARAVPTSCGQSYPAGWRCQGTRLGGGKKIHVCLHIFRPPDGEAGNWKGCCGKVSI